MESQLQSEPSPTASPAAPVLHAMESPAPARPRVWTVFLAFGSLVATLMVVGSLIFGVGLGVEAARSGVNPRDAKALQGLMEQLKLAPWLHVAGVITSSTTGLALALLCAKLSPRPWRERLRLRAGAPLPLPAWVAAMVGCCALGQAMDSAFVLTGAWSWTSSLKGLEAAAKASPVTFAVLLLFGTVGAGMAEELLFRGYMQGRLVERWGRMAGIATTATLFGLLHMDPVQSPMALVIGLFLGWLAEHTGSVRLPVLTHMLNNTVSFMQARYAVPTSQLPTSVNVALLIVCPLLVAGSLVLLRRAGAAPVSAAPAAG